MSEPAPFYKVAPAQSAEPPAPPQTRAEYGLLKHFRALVARKTSGVLSAVTVDGVLLLFCDGRQVGRFVL